MCSDKEARLWLLLVIGLLWATLAWILYDQLTWAPGDSPEEAVYQFYRKTVLVFWGFLAVMGFGALAMTRGCPPRDRSCLPETSPDLCDVRAVAGLQDGAASPSQESTATSWSSRLGHHSAGGGRQ